MMFLGSKPENIFIKFYWEGMIPMWGNAVF